VPLLYLSDESDVIVIASYGGRPYDPDWYRNLLADPVATIQIGSTHTDVTAETIATEERQVWWPRIVDAYGDYEVYQSRTDREIPVVRLRGSE
jgi:deazaflavin-dependent oxidoreductase (nitroreductase family)